MAARLGTTVSSEAAHSLVAPLGVVAQAFDDTPEAATLRRLRVGAVSIPSAPPERQAAYVRALREVVGALGPALEGQASAAPEAPSPAPPPMRRAPAAPVRRRAADGAPSGSTEVAEAPIVPAPPAQRPRRAAPSVTPPPEATSQPVGPDHALPPTPVAAAFERLCPTPLTALPGVGPSVATRLEAAGIRDIGDLLLLRPRKYQDRRDVTPIAVLTPGEFAVVHGRISRASAGFGGGGGRRFMMDVTDETGTLVCTFFRINTGFASRQWTVGREVTVAGPVTLYRERCQMAHPAVDVGDAASSTGELRPVYPEIEGVGERVVRKLVRAALDGYAGELPESLPPAVLERTGLPSLEHALRRVHAPPPDAEPAAFLQFRDPSLRRFIFDELLALQLALGFRRRTADARAPAPIAPPADLDAWLQRVLPLPRRARNAASSVTFGMTSSPGGR
jgi:predicted flap endonuclease-1-like 5' DNA nuclease